MLEQGVRRTVRTLSEGHVHFEGFVALDQLAHSPHVVLTFECRLIRYWAMRRLNEIEVGLNVSLRTQAEDW